MALSENINDLEKAKFRDAGPVSKSKVAVIDESGLLGSTQFDDVQITYPTITSEIYSYYFNLVLQKTIEVTYSSVCKDNITRARVTYAI